MQPCRRITKSILYLSSRPLSGSFLPPSTPSTIASHSDSVFMTMFSIGSTPTYHLAFAVSNSSIKITHSQPQQQAEEIRHDPWSQEHRRDRRKATYHLHWHDNSHGRRGNDLTSHDRAPRNAKQD